MIVLYFFFTPSLYSSDHKTQCRLRRSTLQAAKQGERLAAMACRHEFFPRQRHAYPKQPITSLLPGRNHVPSGRRRRPGGIPHERNRKDEIARAHTRGGRHSKSGNGHRNGQWPARRHLWGLALAQCASHTTRRRPRSPPATSRCANALPS
jgi:hypothetical protein